MLWFVLLIFFVNERWVWGIACIFRFFFVVWFLVDVFLFVVGFFFLGFCRVGFIVCFIVFLSRSVLLVGFGV